MKNKQATTMNKENQIKKDKSVVNYDSPSDEIDGIMESLAREMFKALAVNLDILVKNSFKPDDTRSKTALTMTTFCALLEYLKDNVNYENMLMTLGSVLVKNKDSFKSEDEHQASMFVLKHILEDIWNKEAMEEDGELEVVGEQPKVKH